MKKRYFFWFTTAFLFGIVLASRGLTTAVWLLAAGTFLSALFLGKYGWRKVLLFLVAGGILGFLCFSWHFGVYERTRDAVDGAEVTFSGRVLECVPREADTRLFVRGRIEGADFAFDNFGAYVFTKDGTYAYGDTLSLTARAEVPSPAENFGETDMRFFYMGRDVSAFFYPDDGAIEKTGHDVSLFRPRDLAMHWREKAQERISAHTQGREEGFLRAFITGDKSLMYREESERLSRAGLSHIVAVSGLHLGVVVGGVLALFGFLQIRRRILSTCFCLVFIWFFVLFTGASVSAMRAAIMLSVFFMADFFRRQSDSLTALAFAAFSLCLANPGTLFDISFQLSASSTLGILLFASALSARPACLPKWFRTVYATSLSAFLGFMPLAAYHFGAVSVIGLLANVLVGPLLSPLLLAGVAAVLLGDIPVLSDVLFFFLEKGVAYILQVAAVFAPLSLSAVPLGSISLRWMLSYVFALSGLWLSLARRRRALWSFCIALFLTAAFLLESAVTFHTTEITFLSVGDGDAAVVRRGTYTLLIDGAGSAFSSVGERTVLPYLRREGIRKIDAAFLTYYNTDQADGILYLLENGYIRALYLPYHEGGEWKATLSRAALAAGTPVRYLGDGDTVSLGSLSVSALDTAAKGEENNGLMYRLDAPGGRVLFTGDADAMGEKRLVYRGADLRADILKVSHHGSRTATSPQFMGAVAPAVAVISSAAPPDGETLKTLMQEGVRLCHTDISGAVRIRLSERGIRKISTFRP